MFDRIIDSNPFGSRIRTGVVYTAAGGALTWYASRMKGGLADVYALSGIALSALGVWKLAAGGLSELAEENAEALTYMAGLPRGTDNENNVLGAIEKAAGVVGRAVGLEPEAGVTSRTDVGAELGKLYLPPPKNALRVSGVIRSPKPGGSVVVRMFENTYAADAAVENQSSEPRSGRIALRLSVGGETRVVEGDQVTLAPGEFRSVSMRVPFVQVGFTPFRKHTLALLFANHKLAEVEYDIDRAFF